MKPSRPTYNGENVREAARGRWSDILAGLDLSKMPTLLGYAETTPKPRARVLLNSETDDPLLASWKYGRGTSVAFTSDVQSRWAAAWLAWPEFPRFWEKLARGAMRRGSFSNYVLRAAVRDDRIDITLDAIDNRGRLVNDARGELEVREADGVPRGVPFEQVAPGRYAARLKVSAKEAVALPEYTFHVNLQQEGRPSYLGRRGLLPGFADELRAGGDDAALLDAIAETSGGTANISAAEVFAAGEDYATSTLLLWPYLLAAALLVFLVDVALKRVEFG